MVHGQFRGRFKMLKVIRRFTEFKIMYPWSGISHKEKFELEAIDLSFYQIPVN